MPRASSRPSSRSVIADPALIEQLPPLSRLALAYAPARAQPSWLTLLALDARLSGVVRSAREPMLAQLRLAWWRDRLAEPPGAWPKGEPLLARLAALGTAAGALHQLVDGWEALLGDGPLDAAALGEFAAGRAAAMAVLADHLGGPVDAARQAGHLWASADLALHLGDPAERATAGDLIGAVPLPRLPRNLRPLSVMAGLSLRAVRRHSRDALDGPGAMLAAIRLGITGR